jgi:hypothetical protein
MTSYFKNIITLTCALALLFFATGVAEAMPGDAAPGSTLEQRIAQRTAEQNLNLTEKEITRYTSKCVGAQSVAREMQNKLGTVIDNRLDVYSKVDAKLWIIIGQLKLADKDTFKLESQRAEFANKVAKYSSTLNQYRQTVDDIVVINCAADIKGFMSLVATARQYHESIRTQSSDIANFVVNDIKNTLNSFVTELQTKPSTEQE